MRFWDERTLRAYRYAIYSGGPNNERRDCLLKSRTREQGQSGLGFQAA
jgi:hypothetical protein